MRIDFALISCLLLALAPGMPATAAIAEPSAAPLNTTSQQTATPVGALATQRDWMVNLTEALALSYGLPAAPQEHDYLALLSGQRHYRFEAEEIFHPDDKAFISNLVSYGPFSGSGWLSGTSEPTTAHLRILLPRSGRYRISAVVRRAGQQFQIGAQKLSPSSGAEKFSEVVFGEAELKAGEQEIVATIPKDGGIDTITLDATSLAPIAPRNGWQLDTPLTAGDMASCAIKALALESLLPFSGDEIRFEAENIGQIEGGATTDIRFLGVPSGGSWIRAGAGGGKAILTINRPVAGIYRLSLRALGNAPIGIALTGGYRLSMTFPPFLDTRMLGDFPLPAGAVVFTIDLPPNAGVDTLTLRAYATEEADYLRLAGLRSEAAASPAEIDRLLALLATLAPTE